MRHGLSFLCAAIALCGVACGQSLDVRSDWEREQGHVALQQAARDAATDLQALVVASHPDDRYVMPAAYLRFGRGWRVSVLLITRGEGGQNSKGPEIGDELGWRRTLETEAGVAQLDADVWYLNRADGGFCRTAGEALELWGRESSVRAFARVIRQVQPDVVITTHHPEELHGHDLALLELLPAAVAMAEDPTVELNGLPAVKVAKVFRGPAESEMDSVREALPMDDIDPVRGRSFRELAYRALKCHETQEPILPMDELLEPAVRLHPVRAADRSRSAAWTLGEELPSLFDGLPPKPELQELRRELDDLVDRVGVPGALVRDAMRLADQLANVVSLTEPVAARRLERRLEALGRIVRVGSGLRVATEFPADVAVVAGESVPLRVSVQNGGDVTFQDLRIRARAGELDLVDPDEASLRELGPGRQVSLRALLKTPPIAPSVREWLPKIFSGARFEPPIRLSCSVTATCDGCRIQLDFPIEIPNGVRPALDLEVSPRAILLSRGKLTQTFTVYVTRHQQAPALGLLEVQGPPGFVVHGSPATADLARTRYQDFPLQLRVPESLRPGVYNVHVSLDGWSTTVPVHKVDVAVADSQRIGLIRGVDDTAEAVLSALVGQHLSVLDEQSLATRALDEFDTIVVDIRALRERPGASTWRAARAAFPRLLEYVRRGGRLVVFYHKDSEFNPAAAGFVGSPFPLAIGKDRVTREDAPVAILQPNHVLLTKPNVIRPEDWDGWVQERGLYFPESYAPEFEELIAMADPGQPESRGALLYAHYGKGEYVYCALALYRQLDNLHPGACRLFANLVSR